MKKIAILIMALFVTGCTAVRIDTSNVDNILNVVLSKENKLYNRIGKGYKYYIPRGVSYIDTNDLNDRLYSDGNTYYLYIDAVRYFYKVKVDYKEKNNIYYSKKISKNGKDGYLEITKKDDRYLVKFVYNYARIESLVKKDDIEEVVLNSSYILSTVKFNDKIIELMLNDDYFTNKEEQYDKFSLKKQDTEVTNFLQYKDDEESEEN